jgi:hypothetical protein
MIRSLASIFALVQASPLPALVVHSVCRPVAKS